MSGTYFLLAASYRQKPESSSGNTPWKLVPKISKDFLDNRSCKQKLSHEATQASTCDIGGFKSPGTRDTALDQTPRDSYGAGICRILFFEKELWRFALHITVHRNERYASQISTYADPTFQRSAKDASSVEQLYKGFMAFAMPMPPSLSAIFAFLVTSR